MLLAIDVGNTHSVFGVWDGSQWAAIWRRQTLAQTTEDELAAWLRPLFELSGFPWKVDEAICASVFPSANQSLERFCERWLGVRLAFLQGGEAIGMEVAYTPRTSVGADRLANALGALEKFAPPIIVVDFGTGTNFDAVDRDGTYVGGAIMPGVLVSSESLLNRAAKLPMVGQIEMVAPRNAIGKTTVESLQSGIVLGYAGAIDALVKRMSEELGGNVRVIATGGLSDMFLGLCESIQEQEPTLTLDGLRFASQRIGPRPLK